MDNPRPKRPDVATVALSVLGLLVVAISFVVLFTQDDPTARLGAIGSVVVLWLLLRTWRRSLG